MGRPCGLPADEVFVLPHMTAPLEPSELLLAVVEPTRLRILNCLAAAPLFVSDLQAILSLPQPTVSRHLRVLKDAGIVRDTPIGPFVVYRLRAGTDPGGRLLRTLLDSLPHEEAYRRERGEASNRSRQHASTRTKETAVP